MSALDWKRCLEQQLEPVLTATDSGAGLSTYTDMPFGIFLYPPEDEWELRQALRDLVVRGSKTLAKPCNGCRWLSCSSKPLKRQG